MKIEVKLGEPFWRQVGKKHVTVEIQSGATVQDLIAILGKLYPDLQDFLKQAEVPPTIFLDDEIVDYDTTLSEGDCPTLIWAVSGGGARAMVEIDDQVC